ncbi:hypothetical protein BASA83_004072 [Batrachochytrium salamandrivorans]|nr:hypothetical protein BASA83_004072 [Batrachochytrium salamandrivorans]
MNIFINSYALQFQQSPPTRVSGADLCLLARMRSWTSTLGTGDSSQLHIPLWDIQASGRCKTMGFSVATPSPTFSEIFRARDYTNIPITSKEDHDILPEMIRKSADDNGSQAACEQEEEAAIPAIEEDKENPESPPQIDVCFASVAEIEAQPLEVEVVETVEAVEAVEAATVQHHQSVNRTGDLVWALRKSACPQ